MLIWETGEYIDLSKISHPSFALLRKTLTWPVAENGDHANAWLEPAHDAPQQGGLATTTRPQKAIDRPTGDEHVDILQVGPASFVAEREIVHGHGSHGFRGCDGGEDDEVGWGAFTLEGKGSRIDEETLTTMKTLI